MRASSELCDARSSVAMASEDGGELGGMFQGLCVGRHLQRVGGVFTHNYRFY